MPQESGMFKQLEELISLIPEISTERKYWLIRTQSGSLYEKFVQHGFIAIEHEIVSAGRYSRLLRELGKKDNQLFLNIKSILKESLKKANNDDSQLERKSSLAASQIIKFMDEVKKGDIVLIPSENSATVAFGEVLNTNVGETSNAEKIKTGCDYTKRKKIKWLKKIDRLNLDPYLRSIFQAHQAINNLDGYAEFIERSINNFYIQNGEVHLVLDVKTQEDITAKSLFGFGFNLMEFVEEFAAEYNLTVDSSDIQIKTYLNSPGKINLKSGSKIAITLAAMGLLFAGGGWEESERLKTDGLAKSLKNYNKAVEERDQKRELLRSYMDSMNVAVPKDLTESTNKLLRKNK